jgi:hypothetical protein
MPGCLFVTPNAWAKVGNLWNLPCTHTVLTQNAEPSKSLEDKMMKRSLVLILFLSLLLSACSAKTASNTGIQRLDVPSIGVAPAAPPAESVTNQKNPFAQTNTSGSTSSSDQAAVDRIVIRNATLSIVVTDPFKAMDTIAALAGQMGGFVVSSNAYKVSLDNGGEAPEARITIRVLAEKLNDSLQQVKSLTKNPSTDVLSENVTGQDVTKEFTDLQSRLKNLQQAEEQLREIMASATKSEDVLNIFNQLTQVREQIEVTQGQINYYKEASNLSAIEVTIKSAETVRPLTIGKWQPVGVARDAIQATLNTAKFLANAAIWLVLFALPIGAILYLFIRLVIWVLRKLIKPKGPRQITPPPAPVAPAQ